MLRAARVARSGDGAHAPLSDDDLARELRLPPQLVRDLCVRLVDRGLLVEQRGGGGFSLRPDPDQTAFAAVIDAVERDPALEDVRREAADGFPPGARAALSARGGAALNGGGPTLGQLADERPPGREPARLVGAAAQDQLGLFLVRGVAERVVDRERIFEIDQARPDQIHGVELRRRVRELAEQRFELADAEVVAGRSGLDDRELVVSEAFVPDRDDQPAEVVVVHRAGLPARVIARWRAGQRGRRRGHGELGAGLRLAHVAHRALALLGRRIGLPRPGLIRAAVARPQQDVVAALAGAAADIQAQPALDAAKLEPAVGAVRQEPALVVHRLAAVGADVRALAAVVAGDVQALAGQRVAQLAAGRERPDLVGVVVAVPQQHVAVPLRRPAGDVQAHVARGVAQAPRPRRERRRRNRRAHGGAPAPAATRAVLGARVGRDGQRAHDRSQRHKPVARTHAFLLGVRSSAAPRRA